MSSFASTDKKLINITFCLWQNQGTRLTLRKNYLQEITNFQVINLNFNALKIIEIPVLTLILMVEGCPIIQLA